MKVQDLMRTNVVTLHSSDALDIAADIMNMGRIRHLPVVDADNRVVGIVTQRDLYRASISSVLGFAQAKEHEWLGQVTVRDVMTKEVTAIGPEAGVVEAVDKLVTAKFGCLPVVDGLMAPALPRPPRDLSAPSYQTHISDAELLRIIVRVWIRHMLKENRAVMPHFAGEISADKVRQILTYLRTLPPES